MLLPAAIASAGERIPTEAAEAHRYADGVLYLKLVAAMNEFAIGHGSINDPGHLKKLNKDDIEHIKTVKKAFDNWY
jgi:hypothetical protein